MAHSLAHSVEDTPRKTINYKPPIVLELLGSMLALGRVAESKTTFIELKELRSFSARQKFIKKNLDAWLPLRLQALNLLGFCLAVPNEQPVSQSAYFFSAAAVQEYNCQSIIVYLQMGQSKGRAVQASLPSNASWRHRATKCDKSVSCWTWYRMI